MDANEAGLGFRELCDTYGRMIGHDYSDLANEDEGKVSRFANISLPEACATLFESGQCHALRCLPSPRPDLVMISMAAPGTELIYEQNGISVVARNEDAHVHSTAERLVSHSRQVGQVLAVRFATAQAGSLVGGSTWADQQAEHG